MSDQNGNSKQYRRVCVMRAGYAVVQADTDEQAIEAAADLPSSAFDWEPMDYDMIREAATVVDTFTQDDDTAHP